MPATAAGNRRQVAPIAAAEPDGAERLARALVSREAVADARPDAELVERARAERVHLLLAMRLGLGRGHDAGLPAGLARRLVADMRVAAVEEMARTRELARVAARLEARGCAPVVFKGAALAYTHYEQPWLRPRIDADVLVDESRHAAAADEFRAMGYARPPFVSGRLVMYQEPFVRAEAGGLEHAVDLHWRVANPQLVAGVLTHAELRARAEAVGIPGGRIHVPCAADALVLACVHRAAHHHDAADLLWLYDIHLLAARCSAEAWRHAIDLARARQVAALCWRGLSLSAARFGTRLPAAAAAALSQAGTEASSVFLRGARTPMARLRSDLRALAAADRVRLLIEVVAPPRSYMRARYGARAWLPWQYVRRLVAGGFTWLRKSARPG